VRVSGVGSLGGWPALLGRLQGGQLRLERRGLGNEGCVYVVEGRACGHGLHRLAGTRDGDGAFFKVDDGHIFTHHVGVGRASRRQLQSCLLRVVYRSFKLEASLGDDHLISYIGRAATVF
jgi:hypothetical protein